MLRVSQLAILPMIQSPTVKREENPMESVSFTQRKELAQAHQLGELQKDYTMQFHILACVLIIVQTGVSVRSILLGAIGVLLLFCTKLIIPFYFRHIHLYVYSNGLLYIDRNTRRVARWEQIEGVDGGFINLKNEKSIMMPQYISGYKELRSTIMREIDNHSVPIEMDEDVPAL
jgi:hypothetical protein